MPAVAPAEETGDPSYHFIDILNDIDASDLEIGVGSIGLSHALSKLYFLMLAQVL